ncbi:MAG: DUF362 domain-containing protein [Candidatus Krumholzibacteriota bacterium]|nr:DUF362 domain-containing protein [Candidatus Krumholzibacteriota bacterium]
MRSLVLPGQKVLIKPNLLSAKDPSRAITTHPVILEAIGEEVRRAGGIPSIGDSPGGAIRGIDRVWENTGMKDLSRRTGMRLVNFEASGSREIKTGRYSFFVAAPVEETDVIINAAKLKTHSLTLLTCGIKNMFGVIPGFRKAEMHKLYPKPEEFAQMLVQLYRSVTPQLTIVDAVVAMQGNGPSAGEPRPVGLLAAGKDAVAVDAVMGRLIGFALDQVDTTRIAARENLGEARMENIDITGDGAGVRPENFSLPSNRGARLIPRPLVRLVTPLVWLKLVINPGRCVGCGFCSESCPVDAIPAEGEIFRINAKDCIQCMCCHELCPENAIDIKMSWLARKLV